MIFLLIKTGARGLGAMKRKAGVIAIQSSAPELPASCPRVLEIT